VFNVSFLLSYGIVFGIMWVGVNLDRLLRSLELRNQRLCGRTFAERMRNCIYSHVVENFCTAFAANMASIPLSVEFFGNFSYLTILLNIVFVPLASIIIFVGGVSLLFGAFNMFALCAIVNKLAVVSIFLINFALNCSRKFGHGLINVPYSLDGIWIPALIFTAVVGWCLTKINDKIKTVNERVIMRYNL